MQRYPMMEGCTRNVCLWKVMDHRLVIRIVPGKDRFVLRYPRVEGCTRNVCLWKVMMSQFGDMDGA